LTINRIKTKLVTNVRKKYC